MSPGELRPDDIAAMRDFVGIPLHLEQYNEAATSDTIRHYALGIGDDNPLWLDDAYARTSRYGCRIAPPSFVYSIFDGGVVRGLPNGVLPMHVASELELAAPIRIGDVVHAETRIVSVDERHGSRAGFIATQTSESLYHNQHDEQVARVIQTIAAVSNSGLGQEVYPPRPQHCYSSDEFDSIRRDVLAEVRRGAEPRFWEEVIDGDDVPAVVKAHST